MKLLFDQNLGPRLVAQLAELFPDSEHVRDVGLASADDPPKVIWLRVDNQSTAQIEAIVRANARVLEAFDADPVASMLVVTA